LVVPDNLKNYISIQNKSIY